jgi:hypothetical protein
LIRKLHLEICKIMKKTKLIGGTPIYKINVSHCVRASTFTIALLDYFYDRNEDFNKNITKKEAIVILKKQLNYFGIQGKSFDNIYEPANCEISVIRNKIYNEAYQWVIKKYPHLKYEDNL